VKELIGKSTKVKQYKTIDDVVSLKSSTQWSHPVVANPAQPTTTRVTNFLPILPCIQGIFTVITESELCDNEI